MPHSTANIYQTNELIKSNKVCDICSTSTQNNMLNASLLSEIWLFCQISLLDIYCQSANQGFSMHHHHWLITWLISWPHTKEGFLSNWSLFHIEEMDSSVVGWKWLCWTAKTEWKACLYISAAVVTEMPHCWTFDPALSNIFFHPRTQVMLMVYPQSLSLLLSEMLDRWGENGSI